jgi:hypothetical protein
VIKQVIQTSSTEGITQGTLPTTSPSVPRFMRWQVVNGAAASILAFDIILFGRRKGS